MKGIILAGGSGSRLHPLTKIMSKQLMPVYDKPMIFYPLSTLMEAGIREILIITTAEDLPLFEKLLGDGKNLGCSFSYEIQKEPKGLAQAFLIGKKFIGNDAVVGLYFYPNNVVEVASKIRPSKRGEYEISSVNKCYLDNKDLKIEILGRGFTWLDTGTHDSLLEASNFIKTVEKHSGYKVACLEEITFKMKFIDLKKLKK